MENTEIWKPVDGYEENYEVSNLGKIKSKFKKEHILTPNLCNKYYSVSLCGFKKVNKRVHRIVATAFIPNPNNLSQINHKNGNKLDNRVCNLEWNSPSQNIQHALKNNLFNPKKGEEHNSSKLSVNDVLEIRKSHLTISQIQLAKKYNVSKSCINNVIKNKTWKHVYFNKEVK